MAEPVTGGEFAPGSLLAGKYRIERHLGQGGMGMVVLAHHVELDERVAIKFLLPHALGNAELVARFAREARASVKIKSEHVARTLDVGRLENGAPYMVMEFLEGEDLSARLRARGSLPVTQAVGLVLQATEAIATAHALGIIHRDLKPANLFVVRRADGTEAVKVLDFGISKVLGPGSAPGELEMTRTAAVMGSPLYMPPEQMESARQVDVRSDVYSLGATLFELLAGQPPYTADTLPELITKVLSKPLPQITILRADVPRALEAVISRMLEKDPADRPQNMAEVAAALAPFAPESDRGLAEVAARVLAHGAAIPAAAPPAPAEGVAAARTNASWWRTITARRAGPWLVLAPLLLGGVVLGVGAGAAALTYRWASVKSGPDPVLGSHAAAVAETAPPELAGPAPAAVVTPAPPEVAAAAPTTSAVAVPGAVVSASAGVVAAVASAPPVRSSAAGRTSVAVAPAAATLRTRPGATAAPSAVVRPRPGLTDFGERH